MAKEKAVKLSPEEKAAAKKAEKLAALANPLNVKDTASRSGWNGTLSFGLMTFPIKTYKATEVATVEMNSLHDSCNGKLNRKMWCAACNVEVTHEHQVSGHEVSEGQFIVVTPAEKESLKPDPTEKTLEIESFCPADQIDSIYFESTDYVAPDKGGETPFALLRAAMVEKGVVAIAHRMKGGRDQHVVIRPYADNGIAMSYLYYDFEVRNFDKWSAVPMLAQDEKTSKLVHMAGALIEGMTSDFTLEGKSDRYNDNLKRLIASKVPESGVEAPAVTVTPEIAPAVDLMAALQASLEIAAKTPRPMVSKSVPAQTAAFVN